MNKHHLKSLVAIGLLAAAPFLASAQSQKLNWYNLDLKTDSVFGISTEKAYSELLKGKKSTPVIVGVLDAGVDYKHEDLKRIMWVNKKEKAGNGKDDDKNGYIDDIHGWNFIGGKNGSVNHETLELTRLVRRDQARFANVAEENVPAKDKADYETYLGNKKALETGLAKAKASLIGYTNRKENIDALVKKIGKDNPTLEEVKNYTPEGQKESDAKRILVQNMVNADFASFYEAQIKAPYDYFYDQVNYNYNLAYDPRSIVGDNPNDSKERIYGNNDVQGPDALHGTHVAGIIAADRTNNIGINGVADNVLIMSVRTVPNGDERDKDVANAIRYAADNGAKVLNMSFGKAYVWDKPVVDEAIKYAVSKDVLLVQAAGNDNNDIDVAPNYPSNKDVDPNIRKSWITVGASGPKSGDKLKASFSNYGKVNVDVFAPGVAIYSTVPDQKYLDENGTSMASPVVAGLAALIRSYYPKLTAPQVKEIIVKSVEKIDYNVSFRKGAEVVSVPFANLSVSGGIVNAYNALKLAATY